MTVESNPFPLRYSGDGVTTVFAVTAYFLNEEDVGGAHLKVTLRSSGGTETVLVENTDYTVSGAGVLSGGTITLTTAPASGETLVINRNVPATQRTDYQSYDAFPAETHERALDKLTMRTQQLGSELSRAISFPETDATTLTRILPSSSSRANKALIFDADGAVAVSNNDYADIEAQQDILVQSEAARDAAEGYAQSAAEYYDLVVAAPVIASSATIDRFSGDGSTTGFTLSVEPLNEDNTSVYISGLYQQKDTYSVSGTTLTFSEAPPTGTNNIEVSITKGYGIGTPSDGTISTAKVVDSAITFAKIQDIATDTILGRETSGDGEIEELTLSSAFQLSGGELQLASAGIPTAAVQDSAVTYAKIQDVTNNTVLGRKTSGSGVVEEIGIGSGLTISGGNLITTGAGTGDMLISTYDAASISEQLVGLTASQTMTNKTLTSPVLNTGVSGTAIVDEDDMVSNSASKIPTQQSVKAYVDTGLATKAASLHTHTASAITDLQEVVEDYIGASITAGTNVTVSYNDTTGKTTINASAASGTYKREQTSVDAPPSPFQYQWGYGGTTETAAGHYPTVIGSGAYTGTPTSYTFMKDLAPNRVHYSNAAGYMAGYNAANAASGGRTNFPVYYVEGYHSGKGDNNCFNAQLGIGRHSDYTLATDWLGYNSITIGAGQSYLVTGNTAGYGFEYHVTDGGSSVGASKDTTSGIGGVLSLDRNNATATVDTLWCGLRVQSIGTQAVDAAYQATGSFKHGIDFSGASLSTQAAMILRANHRIVFNSPATSSPTDWYWNQHSNQPQTDYMLHDGTKFVFTDSSDPILQFSNSSFLYAIGGSSRFRVNSSGTNVVADLQVQSSMDGSNYFRASASGVNCTAALSVNGAINLYGSGIFTSSLVTSPTIAIIFKINGTQYKVNAQAV